MEDLAKELKRSYPDFHVWVHSNADYVPRTGQSQSFGSGKAALVAAMAPLGDMVQFKMAKETSLWQALQDMVRADVFILASSSLSMVALNLRSPTDVSLVPCWEEQEWYDHKEQKWRQFFPTPEQSQYVQSMDCISSGKARFQYRGWMYGWLVVLVVGCAACVCSMCVRRMMGPSEGMDAAPSELDLLAHNQEDERSD